MKRVFCNKVPNLELKTNCVRCYILSVLFYGMEAWTLKKADIKRPKVFELCTYHRILRISCMEKIMNSEGLRRIKKEKDIILIIKNKIYITWAKGINYFESVCKEN